jgi:hypothetical protein
VIWQSRQIRNARQQASNSVVASRRPKEIAILAPDHFYPHDLMFIVAQWFRHIRLVLLKQVRSRPAALL